MICHSNTKWQDASQFLLAFTMCLFCAIFKTQWSYLWKIANFPIPHVLEKHVISLTVTQLVLFTKMLGTKNCRVAFFAQLHYTADDVGLHAPRAKWQFSLPSARVLIHKLMQRVGIRSIRFDKHVQSENHIKIFVRCQKHKLTTNYNQNLA